MRTYCVRLHEPRVRLDSLRSFEGAFRIVALDETLTRAVAIDGAAMDLSAGHAEALRPAPSIPHPPAVAAAPNGIFRSIAASAGFFQSMRRMRPSKSSASAVQQSVQSPQLI
jgi:hypothetical protein